IARTKASGKKQLALQNQSRLTGDLVRVDLDLAHDVAVLEAMPFFRGSSDVFAQNLVDDVPASDEQEQRIVLHQNFHEERRLMDIAPKGLYHMPRIQLDIEERQLGIGKLSQMREIFERNFLCFGFGRHVGDTNVTSLAKLEKRPLHIRRLGMKYFAEIEEFPG